MRQRTFYFLLILFFLALDQLSKALILRILPAYGKIEVIPGLFNLVQIHNRGAIFGFFSSTGSGAVHYLLTLASLAALGLVVYYFFKTPASERILKASLSLILAGALGNLADRIFRGYVIDFLDCYISNWHWPSFNIADSCITSGAFLLLYTFLFKRSSTCSLS